MDRTLATGARRAVALGLSADRLTLAGFAVGLAAAVAIALGATGTGLALFLAGRVLDGLDGAVARIEGATDRGGYLDIVCDFAVYAALPLAFACLDPARNALAAAVLLASFLVNGSAFFAFAAIAAKRGLETAQQGPKSIYYLAGLAEGAETILVFSFCCLVPAWFPALAVAFALLCGVSAVARVAAAWHLLVHP
jgi:phosphatidylglycerophosphate synthase